MRLPVAATDTTGGGFSWTTEGELVFPAFLCPDGRRKGCDCGRAFAGLDSHLATTRAVVREVDIDLSALVGAVRLSLAVAGWMPIGGTLSPEDSAFLAEVAAEMVEIGEMFDEGTSLSRSPDDVLADA